MSGNSSVENGHAGAGKRRSPHTIRFLDTEWDRIGESAEAQSLAPAEYVRIATLSMVGQGDMTIGMLDPLIQHSFRATYIVAMIMSDEMIRSGGEKKLEELIAAASGLQARLLGELKN